MINKTPSNFSEFLQNTSLNCSNACKQNTLELIHRQLDGVLKQINMLVKTCNSTIDSNEITNKFINFVKSAPDSIDILIKNIYDICYQELYSKIIRDGDYALRSNRYEASDERSHLLQAAFSNYKTNMQKTDKKINISVEKESTKFVENFMISNLLSSLEEIFLDIPCKQNQEAYNKINGYLNKTKDLIIDDLKEIWMLYVSNMNDCVEHYIQEKISLEKGYTNRVPLARLFNH